ncbi:MAG: hypothetical protein FWH27_01185 [Planctomycetaceae bacterium]|nr:hypothetical protein [Planctomycetaceae bacterium]
MSNWNRVQTITSYPQLQYLNPPARKMQLLGFVPGLAVRVEFAVEGIGINGEIPLVHFVAIPDSG